MSDIKELPSDNDIRGKSTPKNYKKYITEEADHDSKVSSFKKGRLLLM